LGSFSGREQLGKNKNKPKTPKLQTLLFSMKTILDIGNMPKCQGVGRNRCMREKVVLSRKKKALTEVLKDNDDNDSDNS
jgi:excinuclease UvrABC ATPase subunit